MTIYETLQEIERQARSEYGRYGRAAWDDGERLDRIQQLAFAAILQLDREKAA